MLIVKKSLVTYFDETWLAACISTVNRYVYNCRFSVNRAGEKQ